MVDELSLKRLQLMHPAVRASAIAAYTEAANAMTGKAFPRITYSLRTFAEQQALYNQGRTTSGQIVTNAKPGSSYHNYGLALDFALVVDSDGDGKFTETSWNINKDYDGDLKADWMEFVAIMKKHGWFWGGDFKSFKDYPHFEKTLGTNWRGLLDRHNKKDFIPGTTYVRI